jgi:hypothetical protein
LAVAPFLIAITAFRSTALPSVGWVTLILEGNKEYATGDAIGRLRIYGE